MYAYMYTHTYIHIHMYIYILSQILTLKFFESTQFQRIMKYRQDDPDLGLIDKKNKMYKIIDVAVPGDTRKTE